MKLVSAELQNFCQHRYLKVRFAPGLTAVIGRNGSGKSNLIKAIYAAVTGDFGRNDGVKTDNICQFAEKNAPAKVNVVLEHGDSTLSITRSLRPIATRLKVTASGAADLVISKAQEATEAIANILGVSSRILADYVFVDQWSIFDFLSMMPAERAKAFQRLFRTERAEALWKLLGEYHDSIVIPTPGVNKDAVIKRLTENREKHEHLSRELAEVTDKANSYQPSSLQQDIADYQRRQDAEEEAEAIRQRIEALAKEVETLKAQVNQLREDNSAIAEYVQSERQNYSDAVTTITLWTHYVAAERNYKQLVERLDEAKQELANAPEPPQPPTEYIPDEQGCDDDMKAWYAEYNEATQETYRLKKLIDAIKQGVTVCNSCGSPLKDAAQKLPVYEEKLKAISMKHQNMEMIVQKSRLYDKKRQEYETWKEGVKLRIADLQSQLDNLTLVPKPDKSRDELLAFTKQYDKFTQALEETRTALNNAEREYQGRWSVYNQLIEALQTKQAFLAQFRAVTKNHAEAAQLKLIEYDKLQVQRATLEAQIQVLDRMIQDDESSLAQLSMIEKEAEATRAWAEYCLDMRHIFHRDNLPRLVAQNYLELMQDEINNLLIRFGSTFSVQADESLSFMATFHDGRKVPAARLSGGEKVLLALAFRVAVNDIFAKDLGLLVLDEPTAGLDEGNLTCLRIAIERLKELSAARGLQVIMITHERDLHNLFDHVIEVGKEI